jgi:hypothetical protein
MVKSRSKSKGIIAECVYCSQTKEMSDEHYLPECLGRFKNFECLNDRICPDCNNLIGSELEEQFCRGGEIGFMRYALGITGKKHHKKVNPFRRGSGGMPPYNMTAKMLGADQEALFELIPGGTNNAQYIPHIKITSTKDEDYYIRIPDDMTDAAELKKRYDALKIEKIKCVSIVVPTSERPRVDKLMSALPPTTQGEWANLPMEEGPVNLVTNYEVDARFFRAVAKIAFHYLLKTFHYRGNEEMFADIRDFILNGVGHFTKFVACDKESQILEPLKRGYVPTLDCHFLTLESIEGKILSRLQFFAGPDTAVPHVYTVTLATPATTVIFQTGHSFCYYKDRPQNGFDGEMDELTSGRHIYRIDYSSLKR